MDEHEVNDAKIHDKCRHLDVDDPEDASFILSMIWHSTQPGNHTLQSCMDALNMDPSLFDSLKAAHNARTYRAIRNWTGRVDDNAIDKEIKDFLAGSEATLTNVVTGATSLPFWPPNDVHVDQTTQRLHLERLKIPIIKDKPCLLLHEMGSFKGDPELKSRIENIFKPNVHTFLVNTSGSGKTRLLLEGLCHRWGFYFTSMVDSSHLGSRDVESGIRNKFYKKLPASDTSNYAVLLEANRAAAKRIFSRVLLARLIVLRDFLEIMIQKKKSRSPLSVYQTRWLLLQLQPQLAYPTIGDIFDTLTRKLSNASDGYISLRTSRLLDRIRELCSSRRSGDSKTEEITLFCVLDEAQYAATQHTKSFRSDGDESPRPILREIVRTWEEQTSRRKKGVHMFMVVAGTGISKDAVDKVMPSAIMKDSKYRRCSDTGSFETEKAQQKYLKKYLPQPFLQLDAGKRLVDRVCYWLRGRRRFTAGYLTELIRDDFQRPHRLLNAYIKSFTGFSATDACEDVNQEDQGRLHDFERNQLDFTKLEKNNDMMSTVHRITTSYIMRSPDIPQLGKDEAMYVEYGFARFSDQKTEMAVMDEPLVLLAAFRWMNKYRQTCYKLLSHNIKINEEGSNGFENYIVYCLDLIFAQNYPLSKIFKFFGRPPSWADLEAKLVSVYRLGSGGVEASVTCFAQSNAASATLGLNAKSPKLTLSWLRHRQRPPFCFPHQWMGPDVIFILQLSDGSCIWVVLQTKWSKPKHADGKLSKELMLRALKSVTPNKFFLDKNNRAFSLIANPHLQEKVLKSLLKLPHRRTQDAGKYSMLRVIASFPARPELDSYTDKDPDAEGHPIATLDMDLIRKITKQLSPKSFLEEFIPKDGRKRKKIPEEGVIPRPKRRKINLNLNT